MSPSQGKRLAVQLSHWDELDGEDRAFLDRMFDEQIFPILTPLAVDPALARLAQALSRARAVPLAA